MFRYASEAIFAGQRASIGRSVVVMVSGRPTPGIVAEIETDSQGEEFVRIWTPGVTVPRLYLFHATTSPSDLASMPADHWTWPPRV